MDIEQWIESHEGALHELAQRSGAHDDTVHFLAAHVLAGTSDDDIYDLLREAVPSLDGQNNPLASVPDLVHRVRELVAGS